MTQENLLQFRINPVKTDSDKALHDLHKERILILLNYERTENAEKKSSSETKNNTYKSYVPPSILVWSTDDWYKHSSNILQKPNQELNEIDLYFKKLVVQSDQAFNKQDGISIKSSTFSLENTNPKQRVQILAVRLKDLYEHFRNLPALLASKNLNIFDQILEKKISLY